MTVTLIGVPAVEVVGAEVKTSEVAMLGVTVISGVVVFRPPLIVERVLFPAVFKVILTTAVPLTRVMALGGVAIVSLSENEIGVAY